jgi:MinD-like ATPase involved in chromosome partitioning or flagellar assembly
MPTDEERFKYECWAIVQELDPEDIADSIQDSIALVEAIKANHAEDVASIVMNRVELKVRRRAELRVFDVVKTQWIDDIEELQHYRNLRIERVQKALDERKIIEAKMDAPFRQMFDE